MLSSGEEGAHSTENASFCELQRTQQGNTVWKYIAIEAYCHKSVKIWTVQGATNVLNIKVSTVQGATNELTFQHK